MKIKARKNYVVLGPIKREKVSSGGIVMPDGTDPGYEDWAEILSVGEEVTDLKVGDVVLRPEPPLYVYQDDQTGEYQWVVDADEIAGHVDGA